MKSRLLNVRTMLWACILASAALMAALVVGCAQGASSGGFTITDGNVQVDGTSLTVMLACDSPNGNDWTEAIAGEGIELDDSGHESVSDNSESDADVAGYDNFVFKGTGEGTQTITFEYAGPDASSDDAKTVTITTKTDASGQFVEVDATASDGLTGSYKG